MWQANEKNNSRVRLLSEAVPTRKTSCKISLAMNPSQAQTSGVQRVVSTLQNACQNETFKTQVHPAQCPLNTRKPCARVGGGHLRIVPRRRNCRPGDFLLSSLNSLARLWAVLLVGHARTSQLTGQQETANVMALNADVACPNVLNGPAVAGYVTRRQHPEPCGLPFLSFLGAVAGNVLQNHRECSGLCLGGLLCWLSFLFGFVLRSSSTLAVPVQSNP